MYISPIIPGSCASTFFCQDCDYGNGSHRTGHAHKWIGLGVLDISDEAQSACAEYQNNQDMACMISSVVGVRLSNELLTEYHEVMASKVNRQRHAIPVNLIKL